MKYVCVKQEGHKIKLTRVSGDNCGNSETAHPEYESTIPSEKNCLAFDGFLACLK